MFSPQVVLLILILMAFIGMAQIVAALVGMMDHQPKRVQREYGYYMIAVLIYFVGVFLLPHGLSVAIESTLYQLYFFGLAGLLALYHLFIVVKSKQIKNAARNS